MTIAHGFRELDGDKRRRYQFAGGNDGDWYTDLAVVPRMNRAARDWSQAFFTALGATALQQRSIQHGVGEWRPLGSRRESHRDIRTGMR